jgi:hypothetical protein
MACRANQLGSITSTPRETRDAGKVSLPWRPIDSEFQQLCNCNASRTRLRFNLFALIRPFLLESYNYGNMTFVYAAVSISV